SFPTRRSSDLLSSFIPAGFTVSQFTFTQEVKNHNITELESHLASTIFLLTGASAYILYLIPVVLRLLITHNLTLSEWYGSVTVVAITVILVIEFFTLFRQRGI